MTGSQVAGRDPTYLLLTFGGQGMLDSDQRAALNNNFSDGNLLLGFGTITGVSFVGLSISPAAEAEICVMMWVGLRVVGWAARRKKRRSA